MQNITYDYEKTYEKWRKLLQKACRIIVIYVFAIELIMFFVMGYFSLIMTDRLTYMIKYLFVPSMLNVFIVFTGMIIEKKMPKNSGRVNYISILEMTAIATVVACTHNIFSVTLTLFCIPILTTIIYADKKMTNRIFYFCLMMLIVAVFYRKIFAHRNDDVFLVADGIVAFMVLSVTLFISRILIIFQAEKNEKIAEAYRHQIDMQKMMDKDPKTNLYNHTNFMSRLNELTEKCIEGEKPFALAIIDIDNFKSVNDQFGHAKGDKVIINLAELMIKRCSSRQFPARFGGEEFAIIFDERSANNAFEIIEELREEFSNSVYDFTDRKITISCGIAQWKSGWNAENIFDNADSAMYTSKTHGKNRTTIYK